MSFSFSRTQGNGETLSYPIVAESGYFEDEDIEVYFIEVESGTIVPKALGVDYTIEDGNVIFNVAPSNVYYVMVRRITDYNTPQSNFTSGNAFGKDNVNRSFLKALYQIQQLADGFLPEAYYLKDDLNAGNKRITNLADAVDGTDAVTLNQVQDKVQQIVIENGGIPESVFEAIEAAVNLAQLAASQAEDAAELARALAQGISQFTYIATNIWLAEYVDPGTVTPPLTVNDESIEVSLIEENKGQPTNSLQVLQINNTGAITDGYVWLSEGESDWNVPIPTGFDLMVSFYAKSSLNSSMNEAYVSNNMYPALQGIPMNDMIAGQWKRFHYIMPYEYGMTAMNLRIDNDTPGSLLWIDGIMIEKVIGDMTEPSTYQPPAPAYEVGDDTLETVNLEILGIQGWQTTIKFSSTDVNTVAWSAGRLSFQSGRFFDIFTGNTGNMTSTTYIYFDYNVSTTQLFTTTNHVMAVGQNKVCIGVAEPKSPPETQASFIMFGGSGGLLITKDGIAAKTITANQIASNTITASEINVGSITIGSLGGASTYVAYDTSRVAGTASATVVANAAAGATFTSSSLLDYTKVTGTKPPANADKTSLNTALDTTKVNGLPSATLIVGGYIGTGLVLSNSIVSGSITATKMDSGALSTCKFYCSDSNNVGYSVYRGYFTTEISTVALGAVQSQVVSSVTTGMYAKSNSTNSSCIGVHGYAPSGRGVLGNSISGYGVYGQCSNNPGVYGSSTNSWGVQGHSDVTFGLGTHKSCYAALGYSPFTGSHIALFKGSVSIGDVVIATGSILEGVSQAYPILDESKDPMDKRVIGVVAEIDTGDIDKSSILSHITDNKDYFDHEPIDEIETTLQEDEEIPGYKKGDKVKTNSGYTKVLKKKGKNKASTDMIRILSDKSWNVAIINALGEGGINVCNEGGDIEIGDYICTSSTKGKGMKQSDDLLHNYTVAKALESCTWAKGDNSIKMIACTYHCG